MCRRWRELCPLSLRSVRQINLNCYFEPLQCRPALTDQRFKLVLQLLPNLQRLELGPAGTRLSRNGILSIGKADRPGTGLSASAGHQRLTAGLVSPVSVQRVRRAPSQNTARTRGLYSTAGHR